MASSEAWPRTVPEVEAPSILCERNVRDFPDLRNPAQVSTDHAKVTRETRQKSDKLTFARALD